MARGRTTGDGRKQRTYTRISVTNEEKRDVVDFFKKCGKINTTIDFFYSHLSGHKRASKSAQIYKWRKKIGEEATVRPMKMGLKQNRPPGTATVLNKASELDIVKWINDLREEGTSDAFIMRFIFLPY